MVDGSYLFSLDVFQVGELGIKVGKEYSAKALEALKIESQFGKTYARALEYCLMRPHSAKEVRDYLYRKTRPTRTKTGDVKEGISPEVTTRVFDRLLEKGYINDDTFTRFWVEHRHTRKGVSAAKLRQELLTKGVDRVIIDQQLSDSNRNDQSELEKVIAKKAHRYETHEKLVQYLLRQGFRYDDIVTSLKKDA